MNLIIASTSTIHGSGYLEYILPQVTTLFRGIDEVLFIPYARPSGITHEAYTKQAESSFLKIGIRLRGIHEFKNTKKAIENAQGIFVGGGNTFVLVDQLYKRDLMHVLKERIVNGIPYLGTSAGSNICGLTMQTTNDMPIAYPESLDTMGVIPFNINAHYLDPDPDSKHKGETREVRIKEFHAYNMIPVLGLREGSWLEVKNDSIMLKGKLSARVFLANKKPKELTPNSRLQFFE